MDFLTKDGVRAVAALALALAALAARPAAAAEVRWAGADGAPAGVLLLHGGAWELTGPAGLDWMGMYVDRFTAQGARVVNATYAPHAAGLADVVAAYDALDREVDGGICVMGESAGGHLALLLAMERPVACVIARAAPTDLVCLAADGGTLVAAKAVAAFGADRLAAYSPLQRAGELAGSPPRSPTSGSCG